VVEVALAESYMNAGELEAARQHFQNVLDRHGENAGVLNNLANVMLGLSDPAALDRARRAHELAPQSPAIADTLGWVLVTQGQPEEGMRYLREAQTRRAEDPEIRYHVAEALAALGRNEEALETASAALSGPLSEALRERVQALVRRLQP
jgi:predicted Zn-dependent protease